jgi:hypothetical protein
MSTLPWGTMNGWLRLDVEERTTRTQRRLNARAVRAAQSAQAAPVVRTAMPNPVAQPVAVQPVTVRPAMAKADCTEAA